MPPQLTLIVCLVFILFALKQDIKESRRISHAIWIPFLWIALSASKPFSLWLHPQLAAQISAWAGPSRIDFSAGSALDRNLLLAIMLMGVLILYKRRHFFSIDLRKNSWLCLFFFYMLMSASWSAYPGLSAKRWLRAVGDLIMVLVIISEDDEREAFGHILRRCAIVLLPLSLLFIKYYRYIGISYDPFGTMMNVGVTTQKNALGVLCAVVGVFLLWRLLRGLPRVNSLDAFLMTLAIYLLYLSGSATSLVVFIVGSLVLCFEMVFKLSRKSQNSAIFGLLICLLLVQVFLTNILGDSLVPRFFAATGRDMTFTGRVPLWVDLIAIGTQRPLLGAGYGGFWFSNLSLGLWTKHQWRPVSGHNGYIDIFMDLGLLGMVLFLFVLVHGYKRALYTLELNKATGNLYFAYLLMIIMHNFTESTFAKAVSFLWILFLFMIVIVDKKNMDQHIQSQEEAPPMKY